MLISQLCEEKREVTQREEKSIIVSSVMRLHEVEISKLICVLFKCAALLCKHRRATCNLQAEKKEEEEGKGQLRPLLAMPCQQKAPKHR